MDKGAWWATVHEVAKSWTRLSDWAHTRAHTHIMFPLRENHCQIKDMVVKSTQTFSIHIKVKVTQLWWKSDSLWPHGTIQSIEFSRSEYWSGYPFPSPGDLPNPGIDPWPHALQADSLPAEPPGKLKNTRVDIPSFLQRIFPTQESNPGLLHCR